MQSHLGVSDLIPCWITLLRYYLFCSQSPSLPTVLSASTLPLLLLLVSCSGWFQISFLQVSRMRGKAYRKTNPEVNGSTIPTPTKSPLSSLLHSSRRMVLQSSYLPNSFPLPQRPLCPLHPPSSVPHQPYHLESSLRPVLGDEDIPLLHRHITTHQSMSYPFPSCWVYHRSPVISSDTLLLPSAVQRNQQSDFRSCRCIEHT